MEAKKEEVKTIANSKQPEGCLSISKDLLHSFVECGLTTPVRIKEEENLENSRTSDNKVPKVEDLQIIDIDDRCRKKEKATVRISIGPARSQVSQKKDQIIGKIEEKQSQESNATSVSTQILQQSQNKKRKLGKSFFYFN
jgi:hypothetical protein